MQATFTPAKLACAGLAACIVLLPFGRLSEIGVLLCLTAVAIQFWQQGKRCFVGLLSPGFQAWTAIALAALISCLDAYNPGESWGSTLAFVRFAALIVAAQMLSPTQLRWLFFLGSAVICVWTLDALIQAGTGLSLGGMSYADRISGIFGRDNLKLGLVLATLAPLALAATERWRMLAAAVWLGLAAAILLAGARAGWIMFAVVSVLWGLRLCAYQWRKALGALAVGLLGLTLLGFVLNASNDRFAERWARTEKIVDFKTLDFALAGRIPIWQTAVNMAQGHPLNGVGVRNFRYAYPDYAEANDPWLQSADGKATGATHPHQLLLEIGCETGVIGLTLWASAAFFLLRAWRRSSAAARANAWPFGCALLALTFPFNTHIAMYSSFWAGVLWWLVAMLNANLRAQDQTHA
jgi:O-antigen ligase